MESVIRSPRRDTFPWCFFFEGFVLGELDLRAGCSVHAQHMERVGPRWNDLVRNLEILYKNVSLFSYLVVQKRQINTVKVLLVSACVCSGLCSSVRALDVYNCVAFEKHLEFYDVV